MCEICLIHCLADFAIFLCRDYFKLISANKKINCRIGKDNMHILIKTLGVAE